MDNCVSAPESAGDRYFIGRVEAMPPGWVVGRFLSSWKRAISLAGAHHFRIREDLDYRYAIDIDDVRPDRHRIESTLRRCAPQEGAFLCALYSFYSRDDGVALMRRYYPQCQSISGLGALLDLPQRLVLSDLLTHYAGWHDATGH